MSNDLLRDVEALSVLFKAGGWNELRVEAEGFSLLLSTDPQAGLANPLPVVAGGRAQQLASAPLVKAEAGPSAARGPEALLDPSWHPVTAPNLGTFYRSPKPGAAAFVEVGQHVEPETEICLLEVMKLFTSVKAGVAGIIRHIAAADAELVEGGQVLYYIERD